jgi:hypothetical protein
VLGGRLSGGLFLARDTHCALDREAAKRHDNVRWTALSRAPCAGWRPAWPGRLKQSLRWRHRLLHPAPNTATTPSKALLDAGYDPSLPKPCLRRSVVGTVAGAGQRRTPEPAALRLATTCQERCQGRGCATAGEVENSSAPRITLASHAAADPLAPGRTRPPWGSFPNSRGPRGRGKTRGIWTQRTD